MIPLCSSQLRIFISVLVIALMGVWGTPGSAEENIERDWSVSPFLGIHSPALTSLNEGVFLAPMEGIGQIVTQTASGSDNVPTPFTFRNPLPELSPGVTAGLEFQWRLNPRHSLLIGMASWEATSAANKLGEFPIQGVFERVENYRKGRVSYNEFSLGWRYNALVKPDKYNFYFRLSGHELFDIDYREDSSFLFLSGPALTFRRSGIMLSQATGLLMLQAGVGGELFLRDWLSLGFETAVAVGAKKVNLRDGRLTTDFRSEDNVVPEWPMQPAIDNNLYYKSEDGEEYREVRLGFEGWKMLAKISFYY